MTATDAERRGATEPAPRAGSRSWPVLLAVAVVAAAVAGAEEAAADRKSVV